MGCIQRTSERNKCGKDGVPVKVQCDDKCSFSWLLSSDEIEVTVPLLSDVDVEEGKTLSKSKIKVNFLHQKLVVHTKLLLRTNAVKMARGR